MPDGGNAGAGSQFGPGAGNPYLNQYYAVPGRRLELTVPPTASQVP